MIVVDSSVWIDHFRGILTPEVLHFRSLAPEAILVGDVIVLELLRGVDREDEAIKLQRKFEAYGIEAMLAPHLAYIGAANYRALRRRGFTIRTLGDLAIATYCIEYGHRLLHSDRDFDPFELHLGLRVLR
jgi:predicted nucleic acid-binding protein